MKSTTLPVCASVVNGLWQVTQYSTSVRPPPCRASFVSVVGPWQPLQVAVCTMSRVRLAELQFVLGPARFASKSHQPLPAGRSLAEIWSATRKVSPLAIGVMPVGAVAGLKRGDVAVAARPRACSPGSVPLVNVSEVGLDHGARIRGARDEAAPELWRLPGGAGAQPRDREAPVGREEIGDEAAVLVGGREVDDEAVRVHGSRDVHRVDLDVQLPVAGSRLGTSGIGVDVVGVEDVGDVADRHRAAVAVAADARLERDVRIEVPRRHRPGGPADPAGRRTFGSLRARRSVAAIVAAADAGDRRAQQERQHPRPARRTRRFIRTPLVASSRVPLRVLGARFVPTAPVYAKTRPLSVNDESGQISGEARPRLGAPRKRLRFVDHAVWPRSALARLKPKEDHILPSQRGGEMPLDSTVYWGTLPQHGCSSERFPAHEKCSAIGLALAHRVVNGSGWRAGDQPPRERGDARRQFERSHPAEETRCSLRPVAPGTPTRPWPSISKRGATRGATSSASARSSARCSGSRRCMQSQVVQALESQRRPSVIWLQLQECTGCVESVLRTDSPTIGDLMLDILSLDYQHTLMAAAGQRRRVGARAVDARRTTASTCWWSRARSRSPTNGIYTTIGGRTAKSILEEAAAGAAAVIAVGACAHWGSVQAARPNPTGAVGVSHVVARQAGGQHRRVSAHRRRHHGDDRPLPHLRQRMPALDADGRPLFAYGTRIHDQCPRRAHYDAGQYVETFDDEAARQGWCLYKVGCKGPATFSPCPIIQWNTRTSWPIGAGHPCIGCTERNFWDTMSPFYRQMPDLLGFGVERTADTVGAGAGRGRDCRRRGARSRHRRATRAQPFHGGRKRTRAGPDEGGKRGSD